MMHFLESMERRDIVKYVYATGTAHGYLRVFQNSTQYKFRYFKRQPNAMLYVDISALISRFGDATASAAHVVERLLCVRKMK